MKAAGFLYLKIYRKTFLIYLCIVAVFLSAVLCGCYSYAWTAGGRAFSERMGRAFSRVEEKLDGVTGTIDNFYTRLYGSAVLKEDFFDFFGASPAEYAAARLRAGHALYEAYHETYLEACDNLVEDCGYLIRYILYYSAENITCMEYNREGYSRYRTIEAAEGERLCGEGYVYTKDIYHDFVYAGKVSFILDLEAPIEDAFCSDGETAVWLELRGKGRQLGAEEEIDFSQAAGPGKWQGQILRLSGKSGRYFCGMNASERYSYRVVAAGRTGSYMGLQARELWAVSAGLVSVFALITLLYARQFSADGRALQEILRSMEDVKSGSFRRIAVRGRNDEYAAIARQLNGLYEYLETLIQQKYELAISQQRMQMQMLSSQLNPHFLYNTLERIRLRALRVQNMEIAEATASLGLLYRNIVKTDPVISIEKEIEITKQYLDLMCFLYDGQFLYHCDVEEDLSEIQTPKIWMQPIMENFFKHNFGQDDRIKVIVLAGERRGEELRLSFFDNMGHVPEEQMAFLNGRFTPEEGGRGGEGAAGIGLQNVYYRLGLYYGDKVQMRIRNNEPSGVCIEVLLKLGR